ncbi:FAD-dependent monooxygenase [Dactylosporangium vinaceum]|uniref:FAD-dependent monooxygenase n=1 Tax=Dactylosporangium vinaceum TaxID=53362 RepID=A0ABV5MCL1_9ACTN|nr:FAD-dependent monooxygenase [Dactylosporangium vinaceum]UAB92210.1 FAD-dependent monooxygenase [Dactylosporangium vinaceum]
MDILISGASVAGPALALWLSRYGHDVTVVEKAPALRGGGYAVDFRGAVHLETLNRMGLRAALEVRATHMGDIAIVDGTGAQVAALPSAIFSGDLEVLRGDLAAVLYAATRERVRYRFGDHITAIAQDDAGVDVDFASGRRRRFDLVAGCDGVHSGVRRLVFGDSPQHTRPLGVYGGIFTMPATMHLHRSGIMYSEPGRSVTVMSPHGGDQIVSLSFYEPGLGFDHRDTAQQRRIIRERFAGVGWRTPELLDAMDAAADFWFDESTQIHLDSWSSGRVVLLGDAGFAGGPGGNGTGLAVVGAHVLAGELDRARGEHRAAFARYETLMRPYVATGQKQAGGSPDFLVPTTWKKIAQRNRFFKTIRYVPPMRRVFKYFATRTATAFDLPEYEVPALT